MKNLKKFVLILIIVLSNNLFSAEALRPEIAALKTVIDQDINLAKTLKDLNAYQAVLENPNFVISQKTGFTLLMVAARLGKIDLIKALLAAKADPSVKIPEDKEYRYAGKNALDLIDPSTTPAGDVAKIAQIKVILEEAMAKHKSQ